MELQRYIIILSLIFISIGTIVLVASQESGVDRASKATVVVVCGGGYGTGWWVARDTIVTAAHVVESCKPRVVRGPYSSPATVIYYNSSLDIAILQPETLPPWTHPTLEIADSAYIGHTVWAVGYPIQLYEELNGNITLMSTAPRASRGEIAWINPETRRIEITSPTDRGNSGGPVVTEDGAVVGVVSYARTGTVSNTVYAVSIVGIREALASAGVDYGVHHWWENRIVAAIALAGATPLLYVALQLWGVRRG